MVNEVLAEKLEALIGSEAVLATPESYPSIDGLRPSVVAMPENVEQVVAVVSACRANEWSIVPIGSGAMLELGNPPSRADIFLSTGRLAGVRDYEPDELTASVGAGESLAATNAVLAKQGQFLPWDPPGGDTRTVGGVCAVGRSGPLRLGYGQPRDWVLGIEVVTGDGSVVRPGGRVVKNVAGYDLTKLYVGSLGTLGVITSVNVKVRPRPATEITTIARSTNPDALWNISDSIATSSVSPVTIELLSAEAARWTGLGAAGRSDLLSVRLAGEEADVRAEALELERLAIDNGAEIEDQVGTNDAGVFWGGVTDLSLNERADIAVQMNLPPSALREATSTALEGFPALAEEFAYAARPVFGNLFLFIGGALDESRYQTLAARLNQARDACHAMGGSLTVLRAPVEFKRRIDVWGAGASTDGLTRGTKRLFDPEGILNPGRYVAGV